MNNIFNIILIEILYRKASSLFIFYFTYFSLSSHPVIIIRNALLVSLNYRFLVLLLFLIFEWNAQDKEQKLERSIGLQSDFIPTDTINIRNNNLDLYIDLNDGSLRKAYVLEKQERDGLFKTRLMSDDESLKFYFKKSFELTKSGKKTRK